VSLPVVERDGGLNGTHDGTPWVVILSSAAWWQ
jgi:hypothetical protein